MDKEKKEEIFSSVLPQWIELGDDIENKFPVGVASDGKSLVFDFGQEIGRKGSFIHYLNEPYNSFLFVFKKSVREELNDFFRQQLGEYHDRIIIDFEKKKGLRESFRHYLSEHYNRIILIFGKEEKDRGKKPFEYSEYHPRVSQELFNVIQTDLFEPMQKKREIIKLSDLLQEQKIGKNIKLSDLLGPTQERMKWLNIKKDIDINRGAYVYVIGCIKDLHEVPCIKNEIDLDLDLDDLTEEEKYRKSIKDLLEVPCIKNEIDIDLTEEEYRNSIKGVRFENIASKDDINAAKAEIIKAIEEIAEKEHVKLKNKTKKELANLSIILLKKIGEGI